MATVLTRLAKTCADLSRDRRGVAIPEAAIIMAVLVPMLLGGFEVARFALLQQKLSRATMATADLITQCETIAGSEVDSIMSATGLMMQPFTTGGAQRVIVTSVSKTGSANPKIDWQRLGGGSLSGVASKIGTTVGGNATLPAGFLVRSGENAIIAEIYYQFTPTLAGDIVPSRILYHRAMLRPRVLPLSTLSTTSC
jgi:Flp pilus assembly protein TadG